MDAAPMSDASGLGQSAELPRMHIIPQTSLPRLLSRHARRENARRRQAVDPETFEVSSVLPETSESAKSGEDKRKEVSWRIQDERPVTSGGALGRLRHLFQGPAELPEEVVATTTPRKRSVISMLAAELESSRPSTVSRISRPGTAKESAGSEASFLSEGRSKHSRLRFPRLADQNGHDKELERWEQQEDLFAAEDAKLAKRKLLSDDDDDDDARSLRSLDSRAISLSNSAAGSSVFLGHRALSRRRGGCKPRPAILPRAEVVHPVSVGTASTFHINPMDELDDLGPGNFASTTSLFGGSSSSAFSRPTSSRAPSTAGMSWAPSRSSASSERPVDRKWLARVAPISCLPLQPTHRAARQSLPKQVTSSRGSDQPQSSISSPGSAGSYLSFENWGLTDDYIEALLEAHDGSDGLGRFAARLERCDAPLGLIGVSHINLSSNLLTEHGLGALVAAKGPPETLRCLNLCSNRLGRQVESSLGAKQLVESIIVLSQLTELDLGGNSLGDIVVIELCKHLRAGCPLLEGLGLARCELGGNVGSSAGAAALGQYVASCAKLTCLDLNWNNLQGEGGYAFLEGVYDNNASYGAKGSEGGLRRLSLAWNRLGSGNQPPSASRKQQATRCAYMLGNIFRDCEALFHLDLSYNGFDAEDCGLMATGLTNNHTLFGLHLVGNEATVDELGFVAPLPSSPGVGSHSAKAPYGDGTNMQDMYINLTNMMYEIPIGLQLSHPVEISGRAQTARPGRSTSLRCNPSLRAGSRFRGSASDGASQGTGKLEMASASEDMLQAEDSWAMEQTRVKAIASSLNQDFESLQCSAKCCWICENWCQYRVVFSQGMRSKSTEMNNKVKTVYALFSVDGFSRPTQLSRLGQYWAGLKMLPPTADAIQVVFVVDGEAMLSSAHPTANLPAKKSIALNPVIFGSRTAPKRGSDAAAEGDAAIDNPDASKDAPASAEEGSTALPDGAVVPFIIEVSNVNLVYVGSSAWQSRSRGEPTALCVLENSQDRSQVEVLPRKIITERIEEKPRETWTIETSSFRNYLNDTMLKPEECFEMDWNRGKAAHLFKRQDVQQEIKFLLRSDYHKMVLAFWFESMREFQSHRYAIGLSFASWRDFVYRPGEGTDRPVDNINVKSSDVDCIFVAANTIDAQRKKALKVMPEKALARFQFLDAFLRLAAKRYLPLPNSASVAEVSMAVKSLKEQLKLGVECMELRRSLQDALFVEECCLVYRQYQDHLEVIYDGYKSVESYPGRKGSIVSFGGWLTFCSDAMPEEPTTSKLFREAFALGRELRADDMSSYRHMEISYPEFLVCLAALVRLRPGFDIELFSDQLAELFQRLVPLSEKLSSAGGAGRSVKSGANQALLAFLGRAFEESDEDRSGYVSQREFKSYLSQPKVQEQLKAFGMEGSDVEMLFKTLDSDGEGNLSLDELCDGFVKMVSILKKNDRVVSYLRKVFSEADDDGSGLLDKAEFLKIFESPSTKKKFESLGVEAADVEDLFSIIDEDESGEVTIEEVITAFIKLRDPKKAGERGLALLRKMFEKADLNFDGELTKEEYLTAFTAENQELSQKLTVRNLKVPDWENLFEHLDLDENGCLQFDELTEGLVAYWARAQLESLAESPSHASLAQRRSIRPTLG
eukprot:TRINITY_DN30378_c0_g1_i2.p1 TRINITY_DN30378_c0_g1~~TRINITY_DN30378_c0_g1_i2.p1  ORF type:complete len:1630 (+),score=356.30 TRINITY_DN30378_c0_g1_i2:150-5039(+)